LTRHEIAKATGVRKLAIPALCITLAWRVRLAEVVHREAHVKTCPDCNGDGVIEKGTDDEQQCPRAAAVVSCLMTTTTMKK